MLLSYGKIAPAYLLIGLWNKAGDAAVSVQKLLELLLTDDEPLRLSQSLLSCILPVNQQTLEHLKHIQRSVYACQGDVVQTCRTLPLRSYLPADWAELGDALSHVLVHVEGVDDRVELERHLVLLAPVADLVEVVEVALPALSPADQLVCRFVETVTRDGQDVQMVA